MCMGLEIDVTLDDDKDKILGWDAGSKCLSFYISVSLPQADYRQKRN